MGGSNKKKKLTPNIERVMPENRFRQHVNTGSDPALHEGPLAFWIADQPEGGARQKHKSRRLEGSEWPDKSKKVQPAEHGLNRISAVGGRSSIRARRPSRIENEGNCKTRQVEDEKEASQASRSKSKKRQAGVSSKGKGTPVESRGAKSMKGRQCVDPTSTEMIERTEANGAGTANKKAADGKLENQNLPFAKKKTPKRCFTQLT